MEDKPLDYSKTLAERIAANPSVPEKPDETPEETVVRIAMWAKKMGIAVIGGGQLKQMMEDQRRGEPDLGACALKQAEANLRLRRQAEKESAEQKEAINGKEKLATD